MNDISVRSRAVVQQPTESSPGGEMNAEPLSGQSGIYSLPEGKRMHPIDVGEASSVEEWLAWLQADL